MAEPTTTLPFDQFWQWLNDHPGCIVRAGTPEAILYDDDDLHWVFGREDERTLLVQVLRGKRVVGELFLEPDQISYVEGAPPDTAEEHSFELIAETESDRSVVGFFVLTHGLDEPEEATPRRVH
ncbi:MAG: hypothetical protein ACOY3Y_18640 [Acidobacteriota bacterium]